jgi:hypothetical protein
LIGKGSVTGSLESEDHAGEDSGRGEGVLEVLAGVVECRHDDGENYSADEEKEAEEKHEEANEVDKVPARDYVEAFHTDYRE